MGGVDKPFTEALSIFVHYLATGLNDGWGQSWYLFASVYGVLFIVFMRRWISDWVLLAVGIVVEIILIIKFSFFNATASWYDFTFIRAIFYLMVGLLLAKYPQFIQRIQGKCSALQLTVITTFVGMAFVAEAILLNVYHGTGKAAEVEPLTAITAIVIFIWSLSLPWKVPYAREMRQMSTFIYCLHILFIRGIFVAFHIHFNNNLVQWMVVSILCVVVYWIYHWFNQRYHNWWLDHLV